MKIHTGDTVKVLSGKDRGKTGKVGRVFSMSNQVLVAGVNMVKKHVKPTRGQEGGIIEKLLPIAVSNVMLLCPQCGEPTRIGYKFEGERKQRFCKKCGAVIE